MKRLVLIGLTLTTLSFGREYTSLTNSQRSINVDTMHAFSMHGLRLYSCPVSHAKVLPPGESEVSPVVGAASACLFLEDFEDGPLQYFNLPNDPDFMTAGYLNQLGQDGWRLDGCPLSAAEVSEDGKRAHGIAETCWISRLREISQKWQYRDVLNISSEITLDKLNALGLEGWKLVACPANTFITLGENEEHSASTTCWFSKMETDDPVPLWEYLVVANDEGSRELDSLNQLLEEGWSIAECPIDGIKSAEDPDVLDVGAGATQCWYVREVL